jgi:arginine utilization protein RocB
MTKNLFFGIILISTCWTSVFSQNVNLIIQVNARLVVSELSNIYLTFDSINNRQKFYATYVPGDLTLTSELWNKIKLDTSSRLFLNFNYYTYSNQNQEVANFFVELTRQALRQQYLILNIYDFRDKKYKHWYKWHTDKNFLAELVFPNSGLYIRKK